MHKGPKDLQLNQYAMMQGFESGVRAIVMALRATGPAELLPKIGRGPITDPLPDLTEDEIRRSLWGSVDAHLRKVSEVVDFMGKTKRDE